MIHHINSDTRLIQQQLQITHFMSDPIFSESPSASLIKQLAAMIYDSLLIFAVLFFASCDRAVVQSRRSHCIEHLVQPLSAVSCCTAYYAWFWQKSGQTLGMRVWKIRLVIESGETPAGAVCYLRLACALLSLLCLGLGYWWRLFKPYTWHDRLSHTRVINLSAPK